MLGSACLEANPNPTPNQVPAVPLTAALMRMMHNPPYRWYVVQL